MRSRWVFQIRAVPKARPRARRGGGVYMPHRYTEWIRHFSGLIRVSGIPDRIREIVGGHRRVWIDMVAEFTDGRHGDADNLMGGVWDAISTACDIDDRWFVGSIDVRDHRPCDRVILRIYEGGPR